MVVPATVVGFVLGTRLVVSVVMVGVCVEVGWLVGLNKSVGGYEKVFFWKVICLNRVKG